MEIIGYSILWLILAVLFKVSSDVLFLSVILIWILVKLTQIRNAIGDK